MVAHLRPIQPGRRSSVSVVIPNYNYGDYLRGAAMSALSQDADVEVVIVDNASTDSSPDIAASLAEEDSRVKCVLRTTNQGQIANFNEAISYATCDYVVLLCADDLLPPGALARGMALLDSRPDVAFVYGHAPHFSDKVPVARTDVRSWSIWSGPEWVGRICGHGHSVIASPEVIMRRSVMDKLQYRSAAAGQDDFRLWLEAARFGAVGRINGADQGFYRVHSSNQHLGEGDFLTGLRGRARIFEEFFSEGGAERRAEDTALDAAWRRTLAAKALDGACRSYDGGRVLTAEVAALEELAMSIYGPAAKELPEWHGLQKRRRFGASRARYWPPFLVTAVRRRLREEISRRRWVRGAEWS